MSSIRILSVDNAGQNVNGFVLFKVAVPELGIYRCCCWYFIDNHSSWLHRNRCAYDHDWELSDIMKVITRAYTATNNEYVRIKNMLWKQNKKKQKCSLTLKRQVLLSLNWLQHKIAAIVGTVNSPGKLSIVLIGRRILVGFSGHWCNGLTPTTVRSWPRW